MKIMMRSLISLYSMALVCILGLAACANDDDNVPVSSSEADVYLTLGLKIPGHQSPQTRLSANQEATIGSLTVLVFKETTGEDGFSEEKFAYIAPVSDYSSGEKVTVRLIQSTDAGEKYSIVLLANAGTPVSTPVVGEIKEVTLEKYKFTSEGAWSNAALLPMYGEPEKPALIINKDTKFGTVTLTRSVARVDVGLNITNTTNGLEEADGLKNELGEVYFMLSGAQVYNSLDQGYVPSLGIPADAEINEPVMYGIASSETMLARRIYLAEVNNTNEKTLTEKCCLVLGGYYGVGNTTKETYYRVDFVNTAGTELNIVRNYRYIVNVQKVSGPGFDNPDDAFKSGPMNIIINVAEWNEDNLTEVEFDGQNYFKSEAKTIIIPFGKGSSRTIAVKSNIPLIEWSFLNQAEWFENLNVDLSENNIVFTAKTEGPMESNVKLKVRNLTIVFTIKQPAGGYFTPEGVFIPNWNTPDGGSVSVTPENGGAAPGSGVGSNDWGENSEIKGDDIVL
ncbi:hypothetical protein DW228_06005 [Bacteroides fragilis]|uniref:Major fimbrial subunit protein N-terminal domain-containing protein n=1 Tax=Bacteroides fragilis TaxID=817 RepID=A0A396C7U6_BACFG|nr:fimbrial protein [Bacteroides fragilis]RHH14350.1 hypothetical protein DW228_06005 [Bacteroides fragilis]